MESSQKSKMHRGWLAVVLCAAVLVAAFGLWLVDSFAEDPPGVNYLEAEDLIAGWPIVEGTFVYNEAEMYPLLIEEPYDWFFEKLEGEELAAVLPATLPEWAQCEADALFSEKGELIYVQIELPTTQSDITAYITMGDELYRNNFLRIAENYDGRRSKCGEVIYTLMHCRFESSQTRFALSATTTINETDMLIDVYGNCKYEEQAKKDFEAILESFAAYPQGKPDLSVIAAESKPEDAS